MMLVNFQKLSFRDWVDLLRLNLGCTAVLLPALLLLALPLRWESAVFAATACIGFAVLAFQAEPIFRRLDAIGRGIRSDGMDRAPCTVSGRPNQRQSIDSE